MNFKISKIIKLFIILHLINLNLVYIFAAPEPQIRPEIEFSILQVEVHKITSRALFMADNSDTSRDMIDNFFDHIRKNWGSLSKTILESLELMHPSSFQDMLDSTLSAVKPDSAHDSTNMEIKNYISSLLISQAEDYFKGGTQRQRKIFFQKLQHLYFSLTQPDPIQANFNLETLLSENRYANRLNSSSFIFSLKDSEMVYQYLAQFNEIVILAVAYHSAHLQSEIRQKRVQYLHPVWLCTICCEKDLNVLFKPCFHRCVCKDCYIKFREFSNSNKCPICCTFIQKAVRLNSSEINQRSPNYSPHLSEVYQ